MGVFRAPIPILAIGLVIFVSLAFVFTSIYFIFFHAAHFLYGSALKMNIWVLAWIIILMSKLLKLNLYISKNIYGINILKCINSTVNKTAYKKNNKHQLNVNVLIVYKHTH